MESKIEREINLANEMLLAYGLPIITDEMAFDGFSLGGGEVGLAWGECAWGNKMERRDSIVSQVNESAISPEQRAKLVGYRLNLVETTGHALLNDTEENWQNIVDNHG